MNYIKNKLIVFKTSHLIPSIAVTTLTALIAYVSGQRSQILVLIPAILLGQLSVSWCNDYVDRDRDRHNKRKDKPIVSGEVTAMLIKNLAIISIVASIGLSFLYGFGAGVVHVIALIGAFLYNFKLKRTALSILPFFVSFGLLPVFVAQGADAPYVPAYWMIVGASLLAAAIHFQNVIPDFKDDARTQVKGFPHYFSFSNAVLAVGLLMILSVAILIISPGEKVSWLSYVVVGLFSVAALGFLALYAKKDVEGALKITMPMTVLSAVLLITSAQYM